MRTSSILPALLLGGLTGFFPAAAAAGNDLPLACDSKMEPGDAKPSRWRIVLRNLDTGEELWERRHVPLDLDYDDVWDECVSIRKVVHTLMYYHNLASRPHPLLECRTTTRTLAETMSSATVRPNDHRVLLVLVLPHKEVPFWWTREIPLGEVPAGLRQCRDRLAVAAAAGVE